jgi:hypothetical protein
MSSAPTNAGGFRGAGRELAVAAVFVIALAAAAWLLYGAVTSAIIVLWCAGLSLVALRSLINRPVKPEDAPEVRHDAPATTFAGFWRMQTDIAAAVASQSAWDNNTRRRLQNLLAARLAERHSISLTADPEAARAVFLGPAGKTDREQLWYWIDPQRPVPDDAATRRGIPPRVLNALINRLEQL